MIREYLEKHEWAHEILITLYTIVLEFVYAIGMNMFIVPMGIYAGGLMGVCQLIRTLLVEYLGITLPSISSGRSGLMGTIARKIVENVTAMIVLTSVLRRIRFQAYRKIGMLNT